MAADSDNSDAANSDSSASKSGQYIVVARRYRPKGFEDLVGQGMVSQALKNAITSDRVGHAYLFTGARGVGKTSTARILSKALNCEKGPTETPCHECDICESIAAGEDVDVLEIDGASNRGIDEIRQLRSNVSVRPSRSRYKVYIIDEVHMLTKEAFNALLKTLEEPPEHVKFIFCTTDPEKIPITVLSRCQRFDFSPVNAEEIVTRLQSIVQSEGAEADEEALRLLARKAAGSVRDSQSLLEQILSFTADRITVDAVHGMLGTAGTTQLYGVVNALAKHDAANALRELDKSLGEGVDAGQLTEQLLGCIRDLLALSVGGGKELLLHSPESDVDELSKMATDFGTPNLLAAAQIVDQALMRMRQVTHSRVLLETALIRIAQLEDLQALSDLIAQVHSGEAPAAAKKKTVEPVATPATPAAPTPQPATSPPATSPPATSQAPTTQATPAPAKPTEAIAPESNGTSGSATTQVSRIDAAHIARPAAVASAAQSNGTSEKEPSTTGSGGESSEAGGTSQQTSPEPASNPPTADSNGGTELWRKAIAEMDGMAADCASNFLNAHFSTPPSANSGPNTLVVTFPGSYTSSKSFCERPERQSELEKILSQIAGYKVKLAFAIRAEAARQTPTKPAISSRQREREIAQRPFVQRAVELFSGEISGVSIPKQNSN